MQEKLSVFNKTPSAVHFVLAILLHEVKQRLLLIALAMLAFTCKKANYDFMFLIVLFSNILDHELILDVPHTSSVSNYNFANQYHTGTSILG